MAAREDLTSVIGRTVLAPLLSVWAVLAARRLREEAALHAVAVLRDGALAEQALHRLAPDLAPRIGNAWLTRRICAVAAIADAADHENLLNLLVRMRHRPATWGGAAAELQLPPSPAHGDQRLDGETLTRFWDWLSRPAIAQALADRVWSCRAALLTHLDHQVPADAPLLLLDVGYAATVQRCLKRVHALESRPRPIHGLYLLTSTGARWAQAGDGDVLGALCQQGEPTEITATILRHRDLLECLLASSLGELNELGAEGQAIMAPSALSPKQLSEVAQLQAAALDAISPEAEIIATRSALLRLMVAPSRDEAALLGCWYHADATALVGSRRLDDGPPDSDREHCLWPAAARLRREMRA